MSNDDDVRRAQAGQYCWNNWAIEHCKRGTTADVDFSAASLDSISFEGFIFPGRANFSKTVFQRDVSFRGARFQGKARFSEARFHGNARFSCAIFEAPVLLDRIVVSLLCRLDSGKDDPWASWMMLLGATSFLAVCAPAALTLSLSNSVPFVGGKWSTSCDSMMAFRNKCEFRGWPIVLAGLQSAFSSLLLFLIGLGLRNRFRIGSS